MLRGGRGDNSGIDLADLLSYFSANETVVAFILAPTRLDLTRQLPNERPSPILISINDGIVARRSFVHSSIRSFVRLPV
jgi:hypothetical protein